MPIIGKSFVVAWPCSTNKRAKKRYLPYYAFQWSFQSDFSLVLYYYSTQQNTMTQVAEFQSKWKKKYWYKVSTSLLNIKTIAIFWIPPTQSSWWHNKGMVPFLKRKLKTIHTFINQIFHKWLWKNLFFAWHCLETTQPRPPLQVGGCL